MKYALKYGVKYRATVELSPLFRALVTPDVLRSELNQLQLLNSVIRQTDLGYVVEAEFFGRSGKYDLPEQVTSLENIGQPMSRLA